MSRIKTRFINNFCKFTNVSKEIAEIYYKEYPILEDALNKFFTNPISIKNKEEIQQKGTQKKENHIIYKTYEKYAVNGIIEDETFEKFLKELQLDTLPYASYLLSFLSNTDTFEYLNKEGINYLLSNNTFTSNVRKDIETMNKNIFKKGFRPYMNHIHKLIHKQVSLINQLNNTIDSRQIHDLNKSRIQRTCENQVQFIDFMEDILQELLPEKYLQNALYPLFIDFIKNEKQRLSLAKGEFSFLIDFFEEFSSVKESKLTQEQINEKVYLPQLFTDFLEFLNSSE